MQRVSAFTASSAADGSAHTASFEKQTGCILFGYYTELFEKASALSFLDNAPIDTRLAIFDRILRVQNLQVSSTLSADEIETKAGIIFAKIETGVKRKHEIYMVVF